MATLKLAIAIMLFCAQVIPVNSHPFQQFYPQYGSDYMAIITNNCSSIFHQYLITPGNPFQSFRACHKVVDCLLSNSAESIKANTASADVLLGLLPTILALLGSTTPELSLLSSRRPLLAFLLSFGAPAVNPVRTFMYHDPVTALHERQGKLVRHTKLQIISVVILEYVAVGAAVANVWTVSWELGQKAILNISCGSTWLEMLWVGLAAVVYGVGTLAFATRSKTTYPDEEAENISLCQKWWAWAKRWPSNEFSPYATHTAHTLSWRKENYYFIFVSWFVSVGTVAHIIMGTAFLSSVTFIGMTDALTVAGRYMASVLVCRMIVAYELRGMKAAVRVIEEEDTVGQSLTNNLSTTVQGLSIGRSKERSNFSGTW